MVKKNGKHGVRSGNTLRASNSRYNKQYHTDSCIVRNSSNLSRRQSNQVADNALIDADGVLYSLNKKGRWALPQMIKENIQGEKDIKVSIYQRHKISRPSNCVDYNSNKGSVKSCAAKHGYFNSASVQTERNGRGERKTKKKQKEDGAGNEEPISDPDPEIVYDVYYPSPVTSSISHNPKYIRNAELIVYDDGEVREVTRGRKKKGGRHRVNVVSDEPDSYSDTEQFDSFDDQLSENDDSSVQNEEVCSPEVLLIDILESAERARELCYKKSEKRKVKKRKTKSEHRERDWVLVSEHVFEDEAYNTTEEGSISSGTSDTSMTTVLTPSPKLESVRIILQSDTVHPHQLRHIFQDRYIEAACQPRKFVIDTTEDVTKALKMSKSANMLFLGSLDFTSCLVFTRDASYDTGLDVYTVKFNINCNVDTVRIETLFDLMPTTVEEVIQAATDYSTTLSPDCFSQLEVGAVASRQLKEKSMPFVPAVNNWGTQSISLQDVQEREKEEDFELVSEEEIKGAAAAASGEEKNETRRPEYCNICFEEISPELLESTSATCLQRCGHWFCDGCWKEHISERIHSGANTLKCPEYGCSAVVDTGTLLSIANVKHVKMHQHHKATNDVESNPNLKWCPNPKCGRVLMRGDCIQDTVTVNCECGKVICFSCLGDAHWPATCQQTVEYSQQLKRSGDDKYVVVDNIYAMVVRGKKCPKCQRYIEKDGGCKYMECVCGHQFCWTCCRSWLTHPSFDECYRHSDTYNTSKKVVRHIDTTVKEHRSVMYTIAVENRLQRRPQNMRTVKANMNSLSLQLRTLMTKGVDIGQQNIARDDSSAPVTTAAVHEFLVQMVQLKMELNHVIEHTAVFLDRRQDKTGSRKLIQASESFHDLTLSIESTFTSKGKQELVRVVSRLSQLRSLAQRRVVALVKLLAKFESTVER